MKTVYLLRHAKAKKDIPDLPDIERPLMKRGRADAEQMGLLLKQRGVNFDRVLCSPALRARETVQILLPFLHFPLRSIEYVDDLYSASGEEILEILSSLQEGDTVLVCGHNPAIEDLSEHWAGKSLEKYRTCGCFYARFPIERWEKLSSSSPLEWEYFDPEYH
ncbi:MAG: histidine phosphatase family protein [Spirochaetes bacterium]|nr:histidine phosphatase family protein [Spirochaetota bacterium]